MSAAGASELMGNTCCDITQKEKVKSIVTLRVSYLVKQGIFQELVVMAAECILHLRVFHAETLTMTSLRDYVIWCRGASVQFDISKYL